MNAQRIDNLLERVVALLGRIERDHDEGESCDVILNREIDSLVNLGVDCHEMREEIKNEN